MTSGQKPVERNSVGEGTGLSDSEKNDTKSGRKLASVSAASDSDKTSTPSRGQQSMSSCTQESLSESICSFLYGEC